MPRPLFTNGKQLILFYFCVSVVASLVFFRLFKSLIRKNNLSNDIRRTTSQRIDVPKTVPDISQRLGAMFSFRNRPIITEMACEGASAYNRTCSFKNLCFSPKTDRFFALTVDKTGLRRRWMTDDDNRLLDLTTVDNHNIFYFEFEEDPYIALRELESYNMMYTLVTKKTFMFSRFVYNNIMHNMHDDFLGQYILHKKHSSDLKSIDTDNFIFFTDKIIENSNDHLFSTLSKHPFLYREVIKRSHTDSSICFENLIVGNSKDGIWYDYGFYDDPQGPISKKRLHGKFVKEAARFIMKYYNIPLHDKVGFRNMVKKLTTRKSKGNTFLSDQFYISIFSRMHDRLLLNELDLKNGLETRFGLKVRFIQLEVMEFNEIIEVMSTTIVSIGLHGSALVYSMFMPQNSVLLEMFPYAVPGENYSPYRTLSWLPEVDLIYKMWTNQNVTSNFSQLGARKKIENLTPETFLNILSLKTVPPHVCCGNLPWTVRIYQDTVANVPEILSLVESALIESMDAINHPKQRARYISELLEMSTRRITEVDHFLQSQGSFIGNDTVSMLRLELKWESPWRKLSKNPSQYGVWIEEFLEEIMVSEPRLVIETCSKGSEINVWIRPYAFDLKLKINRPATVYSKKFSFKCE